MAKRSRVLIISGALAPGIVAPFLTGGDWIMMQACLTSAMTLTRDQDSEVLPFLKGDVWSGEFGQFLLRNSHATRTEKYTIYVGQGDVLKRNGSDSEKITDLSASANVTVGATTAAQVVSAANNQKGIWVMASQSVRFGGTSVTNTTGSTLAAFVLTYIPGGADLWIYNPNGTSVTIYIAIASG